MLLLQMKNSVRRGLFHPDDIKVVGLSNATPGPLSAPLPAMSRKPSLPALTPITAPAAPSHGPASATPRTAHSRAASFGGPSGSFGKAEARRTQNQTEFEKYAEQNDEDYEDVFGKPNTTGQSCLSRGWPDYACLHGILR